MVVVKMVVVKMAVVGPSGGTLVVVQAVWALVALVALVGSRPGTTPKSLGKFRPFNSMGGYQFNPFRFDMAARWGAPISRFFR